MKRILFAFAAFALAGCPSHKAAPSGTELVSQAKAQLAERERKLQSYRFHGQTTDLTSNETVRFAFAYRSPGKMRGEMEGAMAHVFAFDGKVLNEVDVKAKKLTHYDLGGLPREKADAFLHSIFAAFAPEGFRAPLLPSGKGVTAERTMGEGGKPELKLTAEVADGSDTYRFTYRFSTPGMDLLTKEISGPNGASSIQVLKQSCDPNTGLCFPQEVLESHDGKPWARTLLSEIQINVPVGDADFALAVPEGGSEEKKSLASAP